MHDDRPAAYFSHSYDVLDRSVNDFFVDALSTRFALAVDPRSATLSTVHLEMMMRSSACFIAVVARRENQPEYRCSPFAIHEYGLAVLADRPRLVIPEINVPARHFFAEDTVRAFNRDRLSAYRLATDALDELAERAREHADEAARPLGEVGLILPATPEYTDAGPQLHRLLRRAGWEPRDVSAAVLAGELDAPAAAMLFKRFDFVVLEALSPQLPGWVFPFLQGRGVPTMKLVFHGPGQSSDRPLPALAVSRALAEVSAVNRQALWWSETDGLLLEFGREINRLQMPRLQFGGTDQARRYVWSLGRDQGPVFLSSAQADNDLALQVGRALDLRNIEYFHYLYNSDLPRGKAWERRLLAKVGECRIFVPLVSANYLASDWCRQELAIARELSDRHRTRMLPYFLDHAAGASVAVQGASMMHLSDSDRVRQIVDDVDRALTEMTDARRRPRIEAGGGRGRTAPEVDIVLLAVGQPEYDAIADGLDGLAPLVGTGDHPNLFSWLAGTIASGDGSVYQLLLCSTRPDSAEQSREALRGAVDAFGPDHVVVLGTAVGVAKAGVAVADRVCGFHRLSADGSFLPSFDRSYPTDPAIAAAAAALDSGDVVRGLVAVGDERVPDPAAPAFAPVLSAWPDTTAIGLLPVEMVEQLETYRSHGRLTHFTSISGLVGPGAGDDDRRAAAAQAFGVVRRLVSAHWPRPPRADTTDRGEGYVAAGAD